MDPLAGSALSILEDGGGLPLVLDRLDEDDALCAALACTTLRDVLFAQARHVVRAAGKPYAGKRIVTSVAGVASSAGRLAWVRGLGLRAWRAGSALWGGRVACVVAPVPPGIFFFLIIVTEELL